MDNSPEALLRDTAIIVVLAVVTVVLLVFLVLVVNTRLALYGLVAAFVLLVAVLVWDTAARR